MAVHNQKSQDDASREVSKVHEYPVLQHAGEFYLLLQERDDQKAVAGEKLASRDQHQGQAGREHAGSHQFPEASADGSRSRLIGDSADADKDTCHDAENEQLECRRLYLTFSDSHIVFRNFCR